jgi:hypothetical protein
VRRKYNRLQHRRNIVKWQSCGLSGREALNVRQMCGASKADNQGVKADGRDNPGPPCPRCGAPDPTPIVYGYPDNEMLMMAERGEVVLGGCCIYPGMTFKCCRLCGKRYGAVGE